MSKRSKERRQKQQQRIEHLRQQEELAEVHKLETLRDKILRSEVSPIWGEPESRMDELDATLPRAQVISAANVYDYTLDHDAAYDNPDRDWKFTGIMPPFEYIFLDFGEDQPLIADSSASIAHSGAFIRCFEIEDWETDYDPAAGRCMLEVDLLSDDSEAWHMGAVLISLDPSGNPLWYASPHLNETDYSANARARFLNLLYPTLMTLQFLNCKGVEIIDVHLPEKAKEIYKREYERELTVSKILKIHPFNKRYRHEDANTDNDSDPKRLHIVRGHFAHYTSDRPLFGKYTGTFWISAHVRGDLEKGIVVKDYEVLTGG